MTRLINKATSKRKHNAKSKLYNPYLRKYQSYKMRHNEEFAKKTLECFSKHHLHTNAKVVVVDSIYFRSTQALLKVGIPANRIVVVNNNKAVKRMADGIIQR